MIKKLFFIFITSVLCICNANAATHKLGADDALSDIKKWQDGRITLETKENTRNLYCTKNQDCDEDQYCLITEGNTDGKCTDLCHKDFDGVRKDSSGNACVGETPECLIVKIGNQAQHKSVCGCTASSCSPGSTCKSYSSMKTISGDMVGHCEVCSYSDGNSENKMCGCDPFVGTSSSTYKRPNGSKQCVRCNHDSDCDYKDESGNTLNFVCKEPKTLSSRCELGDCSTIAHCEQCDNTKCLKCLSGFYLVDGQCVCDKDASGNKTGKFFDEKKNACNTCDDVMPGCYTCSDRNVCTQAIPADKMDSYGYSNNYGYESCKFVIDLNEIVPHLDCTARHCFTAVAEKRSGDPTRIGYCTSCDIGYELKSRTNTYNVCEEMNFTCIGMIFSRGCSGEDCRQDFRTIYADNDGNICDEPKEGCWSRCIEKSCEEIGFGYVNATAKTPSGYYNKLAIGGACEAGWTYVAEFQESTGTKLIGSNGVTKYTNSLAKLTGGYVYTCPACAKCPDNCLECEGFGKGLKCTSCKDQDNFIVGSDGLCRRKTCLEKGFWPFDKDCGSDSAMDVSKLNGFAEDVKGYNEKTKEMEQCVTCTYPGNRCIPGYTTEKAGANYCAQGFYLSGSDSSRGPVCYKCDKCPDNCLTCDNASKCTSCLNSQEYTLTGGKCIRRSCKEMNSKWVPGSGNCGVGKFEISTDYAEEGGVQCFACESCPLNCDQCSRADACTVCSKGFYKSAVGTQGCIPCSNAFGGCVECNNTGTKCIKCHSGAFCTSSTYCQTSESVMCPFPLMSSFISGGKVATPCNECNTCQMGYTKSATKKNDSCVETTRGFYCCKECDYTSQSQCQMATHSTCKQEDSCWVDTLSEGCVAGYWWGTGTSTSTCYACGSDHYITCEKHTKTCSDGYVLSNNICKKCGSEVGGVSYYEGCKYCDGSNPEKCSGCFNGYFLDGTVCRPDAERN
ncbi:MAG: hypothetical protein MJ247_06980 [Alphaproteobacteria bacterium]|nr:hypothetical protein [Alphaproteobacteria bacterium]